MSEPMTGEDLAALRRGDRVVVESAGVRQDVTVVSDPETGKDGTLSFDVWPTVADESSVARRWLFADSATGEVKPTP
jgi:hypothetical protein